ncbi:MAG: replicative DNA helicase, partial [Verrucomicrobiia bacterium]
RQPSNRREHLKKPTLDRQPPNSPEMEIGVLGCQLLDPNQCVNNFIQKFKDGALVHYDLRHQVIQSVILAMFEERKPISIITVQQYLKDRGELDQIGGLPYLMQIEDIPSAANFSYYAGIVEEKYTMRRLIKTCTEIMGRVYEASELPNKILEQAEQEILKIRSAPSIAKDIRELMQGAIDLVEKRATNWDLITGLSTGLADLDKMTDGLHGGEFIVIGASTSCGKTALALNIIVHNALKKIPAGFLSAEMIPVRLALRSLCAESRVNFKKIGDNEIPAMTRAAGRITNSPIHIDSINGFSIGQVRAMARRMKQQHGIKILAVENIQLLSGTGDNREQEIASISRGLKGLALELDIAVLGLSQLNDDGKLRESRAIGHDADSAWIIANDGAWQPKIQPVILKVEKCRDGETGIVNLTFVKEHTRFEQSAKVDESDVPNSCPQD